MIKADNSWYIICSKPKKEQEAEISLNNIGIDVYLPLCKKKKKSGKYKIEVVSPLFPGYLFAKFEFETYFQKVRYSRGVKKLLGNGENLWMIEEIKIEDIKNREEDGLVRLRPKVENFSPGDRIIVDEGDFEGWEGIFYEDFPEEKRAMIMLTSVSYTNKMLLPKSYLTLKT